MRRHGDPRDRRRLEPRGVLMWIRRAQVEGRFSVALGLEEEHLLDVAQRGGRQSGRGQRGHSGGAAAARPVGSIAPVRDGDVGEGKAEGVSVGGRRRHIPGWLGDDWTRWETTADGRYSELFLSSTCPPIRTSGTMFRPLMSIANA